MGRCLEETGWIRRGERRDGPRSYTPLLLHQTEKRHRVPANVLHAVFLHGRAAVKSTPNRGSGEDRIVFTPRGPNSLRRRFCRKNTNITNTSA